MSEQAAKAATDDEVLNSAFARLRLQRYPVLPRSPLRAWDAADEYLLQWLADNARPAADDRLLLVNDAFGALALSLHDWQPRVLSDSYLAMQAMAANARLNSLPAVAVSNDLDIDSEWLDNGSPNYLLLKIPKSLGLLEDQLHRLRPLLTPSTHIIAAGMSRHIHRSTLELFSRLLGSTTTSLARKKARLIFCEFDAALAVPDNPWPKCYSLALQGHEPLQLCDHAGVFSAGRLDAGTRLLLAHLPADAGDGHIVDMACGNGVLGIHAARLNPQARLSFSDESYRAVSSAADNFARSLPAHRQAEFLQTDGLEGIAAGSASRVLCNPPFHQQHAVGDAIAWRMFQQAREVLQPQGELWLVANRHLGYHAKLKRLFGNREIVASNRKFVVLKARKLPANRVKSPAGKPPSKKTPSRQ